MTPNEFARFLIEEHNINICSKAGQEDVVRSLLLLRDLPEGACIRSYGGGVVIVTEKRKHVAKKQRKAYNNSNKNGG